MFYEVCGMAKKFEPLHQIHRLIIVNQHGSSTRNESMKTTAFLQAKLIRSGFSAVLAACAGAALLVSVNSAFAQIDPGVKSGVAGNAYHNPPADKGQHNPPADKCGHNPPADKSVKAGENRAVSPAAQKAAQATQVDAPKVGAVACPKN
jgi:hypothetical protein